MRFFPKIPDVGFWRKWNMLCVMFIGGCLLAARFYRHVPEVVESAEKIMWFGFGGLVLGVVLNHLSNRN